MGKCAPLILIVPASRNVAQIRSKGASGCAAWERRSCFRQLSNPETAEMIQNGSFAMSTNAWMTRIARGIRNAAEIVVDRAFAKSQSTNQNHCNAHIEFHLPKIAGKPAAKH